MIKRVNTFISIFIKVFKTYCDVFVGTISSIIGVYFFFASNSIKISRQSISMVDSAQFTPKLVFGGIVIFGFFTAIKGIILVRNNRESYTKNAISKQDVDAFKRGFVALFSIAIFIFLIKPFGFIIAAILYMLFSMFFLSVRKGWKPVSYVIVSISVAIFSFYIFKKYLFIQLPAGILEGVLK
jgi:hypothetical protein